MINPLHSEPFCTATCRTSGEFQTHSCCTPLPLLRLVTVDSVGYYLLTILTCRTSIGWVTQQVHKWMLLASCCLHFLCQVVMLSDSEADVGIVLGINAIYPLLKNTLWIDMIL